MSQIVFHGYFCIPVKINKILMRKPMNSMFFFANN